MRTHYFLLIGFIFVTTISFGQSEDEAEIRRLEKHWTELLDQGDTASLLQIWSENYVVNNPNGKIVTPKDIIALMKGGHKFPAVERIIEKVTFNENIAIVMGKELQQPAGMVADRDQWIPRRFTNVWIKSENGWQLAARQSSRQIVE
ncbi:nuclear transport factor 2 family protein [Sinomicrobium weinanense]|uniref:Nuclear transport factor 2 family protein n=1 Tax=Sinomicrobium weinanense TaxID=2842200 RepID=A0A926JSE3_9FLAO|nr:nuclear transport factor 2 family protein [Sinomicrobium weinanense]MBC9796618.1 nuclear transport factor 2 family protein [Sinomicrobium weinanense]MBU3123858.1 nuclear transport factor 2 family protein [Sinomicrobium weinanense]